ANSDMPNGSSMCLQLKPYLQSPSQGLLNRCMGYLETQHQSLQFQHFFYLSSTFSRLNNGTDNLEDSSVALLDEYLERYAEHGITIVDQLKLAKEIAIAVLRFHSTPWLNLEWRTRDLSFFGELNAPQLPSKI